MKKFIKIVIGIAAVAVILYGIYLILPEYSHNQVRSLLQKQFKPETQTAIKEVQGLINPDLNVDYKTILESHTDMNAWVYDQDASAGSPKVTYYGTHARLNLKNIDGGEGLFYSDARLKVVFSKDDRGNYILELYLNDDSTPQEPEITKIILGQLLTGVE